MLNLIIIICQNHWPFFTLYLIFCISLFSSLAHFFFVFGLPSPRKLYFLFIANECMTDEWDISASRQMARYHFNTPVNSIEWKPFHNVACNSWTGTEFSVWGNSAGQKSLWLEWGKVSFSAYYIYYIYTNERTRKAIRSVVSRRQSYLA